MRDPKQQLISVPIMIHPRTNIILFSAERIYLTQPDKPSKDFPDLELPAPILGPKFKPTVNNIVILRDNPKETTSKYYKEVLPQAKDLLTITQNPQKQQ